jgi:hypothetical protein
MVNEKLDKETQIKQLKSFIRLINYNINEGNIDALSYETTYILNSFAYSMYKLVEYELSIVEVAENEQKI